MDKGTGSGKQTKRDKKDDHRERPQKTFIGHKRH